MATRNIVPRANEEGQIGTSLKKWNQGHFKTIYADTYDGVNTSGGSNKRIFDSSQMRLDDTNTGSDSDTIFGIIDTISFSPSSDGSVWMTMDFNDDDFDTSTDITVDLTHVFDGNSGGTEAVRLQIDVWVADIGEAPASGSPTTTQTTDLSVTTSNDNTIQEQTSFITIANSNLNSNTRTISFKVTRDADHANDSYGGTYQLINLIAKQ